MADLEHARVDGAMCQADSGSVVGWVTHGSSVFFSRLLGLDVIEHRTLSAGDGHGGGACPLPSTLVWKHHWLEKVTQ